MNKLPGWHTLSAAFVAAVVLSACGGGGDTAQAGASPPVAVTPPPGAPPQVAGAPVATGVVATDGLNWINYRRGQVGIPVLTRNVQIDLAAQRHSDYQRSNNTVTHDQETGKPGFTGVALVARLQQAGFVFTQNANYAYGEVISGTNSTSGAYMAEELITAIYHRFVIFEPRFKEIGTGSATSASGYNYFTTDFAANNGYGPGLGRGGVVTWPTADQAGVTRNFFSDYEAPDPVPGANEVGYPVSVHADIDATLTATTFTMRARGEADTTVKLLTRSVDGITPKSAAAIVPLTVLRAATTYDVTFMGTVEGVPVSRTWSFTTR